MRTKTRENPSRCKKPRVRCAAKRSAPQQSCDEEAFQRYELHVLPQAGLDSLPRELLTYAPAEAQVQNRWRVETLLCRVAIGENDNAQHAPTLASLC